MNQVSTQDRRNRVVIEALSPQVDGGRFPVKRIQGDSVEVQADIFADGHDVIVAVVKYRGAADSTWTEERMRPLVNDRWTAAFATASIGLYFYTVEAWIDPFRSWKADLEKKFKAGQEVRLELRAGAQLFEAAAARAHGPEKDELAKAADTLASPDLLPPEQVALALSPNLTEWMDRSCERKHSVQFAPPLRVQVDPPLAQFSAWYEMFPRSSAPEPGRHGTLQDCERQLPRIAAMGFDILYLPPIHPIGSSFRKGRNNSLVCQTSDPGSPWAIGATEGGHKSIHPELGTLDDFRRLVQLAHELRMEVALDIAFQCSPDHPYVREHPNWFRHRPDGSVQYAENPPKRYQDIYPLHFESEDWAELWKELKSVFEFWIEQGVRVFRVDNPHTKPFSFWEWCLEGLKEAHPELIFLSEAFTRPKIMFYLAKIGFTQSYNYFPWRNTKYELTQYLTELTQTPVREFFRPNLWPNTPDILTQYLRFGGRPAFMARAVLAATLGTSYGIYGPAFELCETQSREPESEDYLNSEKYEIRQWNLHAPGNIAPLLTSLNRIRREHPAFRNGRSLRFHEVDNDQLIAYSRRDAPGDDVVLIVVNLDPQHTQRGWVSLPLEELKLGPQASYQVHELLTDSHFLWQGPRNYVELDPKFVPAHVFHLRRYVRTEHDFDYFV